MARIVSNSSSPSTASSRRRTSGTFPYFDDEMGRIVGKAWSPRGLPHGAQPLPGVGAVLAAAGREGRRVRLYINTVPKYVLSHHEGDADWQNTTVITGPDDASVAAQVRALKEQVDGDIAMSGCATTVRWLIAQGLLDELALLVHPLAVAKGQRLFEGTGTVPLTLLSCETLPTGVLFLRYAPEAPGGGTGRD